MRKGRRKGTLTLGSGFPLKVVKAPFGTSQLPWEFVFNPWINRWDLTEPHYWVPRTVRSSPLGPQADGLEAPGTGCGYSVTVALTGSLTPTAGELRPGQFVLCPHHHWSGPWEQWVGEMREGAHDPFRCREQGCVGSRTEACALQGCGVHVSWGFETWLSALGHKIVTPHTVLSKVHFIFHTKRGRRIPQGQKQAGNPLLQPQ